MDGNFVIAIGQRRQQQRRGRVGRQFRRRQCQWRRQQRHRREESNFDISSPSAPTARPPSESAAGLTPHSPTAPAAYADAGVGNGNNAISLGDNSSAIAGVGNGNLAAAISGGDATAGGLNSLAFADGANSDAQAVGIGDIASIINTGSGFDQAISGGTAASFSDNDLALIIGTDSTALAGNGGDWDIAGVFGDMLHASGDRRQLPARHTAVAVVPPG